MTELLSNYLGGQWQQGTGAGTPLFDPVRGLELVRFDATGLDLAAGFEFAREQGGAALRTLTYRLRAPCCCRTKWRAGRHLICWSRKWCVK